MDFIEQQIGKETSGKLSRKIEENSNRQYFSILVQNNYSKLLINLKSKHQETRFFQISEINGLRLLILGKNYILSQQFHSLRHLSIIHAYIYYLFAFSNLVIFLTTSKNIFFAIFSLIVASISCLKLLQISSKRKTLKNESFNS